MNDSIKIWLGITIVLGILIFSYNVEAHDYYLSHHNVNYGGDYAESDNYKVDFSIIEQPIGRGESTSYRSSMGFYHAFQEFFNFGITPIFWVWLAGVVMSGFMIFKGDEKKGSGGKRKRLIGSTCLIIMGVLAFYVTNSYIGVFFLFISLIVMGFTIKEVLTEF